jgi:AcrR family transcriptional regulator
VPDNSGIRPAPKSEETRQRILRAALKLFQERGFDAATMRDIAEEAGMATGAAYYYFPSKDAIVMEFYRDSSAEMQPKLEAALQQADSLDQRLYALTRVKWDHFAPHRGILRTLLRNGADPAYPLSPFSSETREIRSVDIEWFRRSLANCGVRIPNDLAAHLPDLLWFFQMGAIYFWVIDESLKQVNSERLLAIATKSITALIRISVLPLMRPVRKAVLEAFKIVKETAPHRQ